MKPPVWTTQGFFTRILMGVVSFAGVVLFGLGWGTYYVQRTASITQATSLQVAHLRGTIVYLDEVLTMSARMAAASGDQRWEQRYRLFEPQLEAAIRESMRLVPELARDQTIGATDAANRALVEMEHRSFALVDQGRREEAQVLLASAEYERYKKLYAEGMDRFSALMGESIAASQRETTQTSYWGLTFVFGIAVLLVAGWFASLIFLHRGHGRVVALQHEVSVSRTDVSLQRVRNEILLMREVEDWRKLVVAFEQNLREVIEFNACGINILDRQSNRYVDFETSAGTIIEKRYDTLPRALVQALDTGKPVYRRNRAEIDQFEDLVEAETNCVLDIPFAGGTIAINSTREDAFSARDIQVLAHFAQVLNEAHRRLEDLKKLALQEAQLQQARKLEAIGQLATGVAHEINNPLTSVIGYSELLLRRELDPEVRARLETIRQEGQRAEGIAARLLHLARQQQSRKEWQPLNPLVHEVLELVRPSFEVGGVQLEGELAEGLPLVEVHPGQLQQVLLALVQNSREAILQARTGHRVGVRTRAVEGWVRLEVEDDGPGIPAAIRQRIFEPFFTTKGVGKGPGLGLSIGHAIAREHGGRLWVAPREGGALVVLELPTDQAT